MRVYACARACVRSCVRTRACAWLRAQHACVRFLCVPVGVCAASSDRAGRAPRHSPSIQAPWRYGHVRSRSHAWGHAHGHARGRARRHVPERACGRVCKERVRGGGRELASRAICPSWKGLSSTTKPCVLAELELSAPGWAFAPSSRVTSIHPRQVVSSLRARASADATAPRRRDRARDVGALNRKGPSCSSAPSYSREKHRSGPP